MLGTLIGYLVTAIGACFVGYVCGSRLQAEHNQKMRENRWIRFRVQYWDEEQTHELLNVPVGMMSMLGEKLDLTLRFPCRVSLRTYDPNEGR